MPRMIHPLRQEVTGFDAIAKHEEDLTRLSEKQQVVPAGREGLDHISRHWEWVPTGALFRTRDYANIGGFHPTVKYAGDCDLLVRWLASGRNFCIIREPLLYKRLHDNSTTSLSLLRGWDSEGYCYLMLRYASLRTFKNNFMDHARWFLNSFRTTRSALRQRNGPLFYAGARGMSIAARSYLSLLIPMLQFTLPKQVKTHLRLAIPLVQLNSSKELNSSPCRSEH